MQDRVIHMILPKGGSGIKIIELAGWTGKVFLISRTNLKDIKNRPDSSNPRVYFLFGESGESTKQQLYIVESENFFDRLINHDSNKGFWNFAVVFVGGLDKAKVRYIEWIASQEAHKIGRFEIKNSVSRNENTLSEYDEITTKDFFENMKFILNVLGFPIFENVKESILDKNIYKLIGENFDAKA